MKKIIFLVIFSVLFSIPSLAQGTSSLNLTPTPKNTGSPVTSSPGVTITNSKKELENLKDVKATTVVNKEETLQKRKENITKYYKTLKERLLAGVERLKKLALRISTRLDKLTAKGYDVTSLKQKLAEAELKLDKTEVKITSLDAQMEEITTSKTPKIAFEKLRTSLKEIKQDLKEVHQEYVEIIIEIKALLPKVSTTPNITGE